MTGSQAPSEDSTGTVPEAAPTPATPKVAVSSLPSLKSEEVRSRAFKRATRGVSEAEVRNYLHRIADELDAGRERERSLERRIDELEARLADPPPVTEDVLLEAFGAETARVLRTAQDAAREIRRSAEEASTNVVAEADTRARELRDEGEAFLVQRREEGEALATRLRSEAEELAKQLESDARTRANEVGELAEIEAQRAKQEALEQARAMVAEAKAVRERVLTDLARRRRALQTQLEELRNGRERLLEGYQVVRRTLADATRALGGQVPEPDIDLEALTADEPALEDPDLDRLLEEAARASEEVGVESEVTVPETAADSSGEVSASTSAAEPEEPETRPADQAVSDEPPAEEPPANELPADEPPPDEEAVPQGSGLRGYVKTALGLGADAPAVDEVEVEEAEVAQAGADARDGTAVAGEAAESTTSEESKRDPQAVFAKLRSGDDESETSESGSEESATSDDLEESDGAEAPALTGDAAFLAERDDTLAPVEAALARAIKREVQNDQNELLDAIRRAKRRKDLTPLLPERTEIVGAWSTVVADPLATAYGGTVPDEFVASVTDTLIGSLHDRLRDAITEGGDNEALTQRIGARFREWRSQELPTAVAEVVATAHTRGVFDRAKPGSRLRWVAARPGRCPDCDDNALEATVRGEDFPTGQAFPPAHPGCRCLLVVED